MPLSDKFSSSQATRLLLLRNNLGWSYLLKIIWPEKRLWWDDYIIIIPLILGVVYVTQLWVKYGTTNIAWEVSDRGDFFTGAWFGIPRISLLLSLARILPPRRPPWILVYVFVVLFFLIYIASIVISTVTCPCDSVWWRINYNGCFKTSAGDMIGTMVGVVLDFIADVILVAFPLAMLRKVRIPGEERILVLVLFCSSLITLTASIGYCTVWYSIFRIGPESRLIFVMFAHMQADASMISANILVVVMMVYRRFRPRTDSNERPRRNAGDADGSSDKSTNARQHSPTEYTIDTATADSSAPSYTVISVSFGRERERDSRESSSQGGLPTGLGSILSSVLSSSRHSNLRQDNTDSDDSGPGGISNPITTSSSWDFSSFEKTPSGIASR
ncbi:hypothetical protein BJ165DRAFT_1403226 [Panaeolus papilionaceus]|nr:hypothetical protein BJ165DRAFT_1403226 [Panaeolus papilionaceus]